MKVRLGIWERTFVACILLLSLWYHHTVTLGYTSPFPLRGCCSTTTKRKNEYSLPLIFQIQTRKYQSSINCRNERKFFLSSTKSSDSTGNKSSNDSTTPKNSNNRQRKFRIPNLMKRAQSFIIKLRNLQAVYLARFQSLSRRSKMIVLFQFCVLFGGMSSIMNRIYIHNSPIPPPIEISYSSFLDLIEHKPVVLKSYNNNNNNDAFIPKIDHVRIGSDRFVYRLYNSNNNNKVISQSSPSLPSSLPTVTPTTTAKTTFGLTTPSKTSKQQRQRSSKQPSYIQAYTKKISATPELINQLRINDISFAAAVIPRTTSTLAIAARTILIGFYCIILFRLYRTISGSGITGGSNKNDGVGKLANRGSDLPLATFDEIQGIDNAKVEVMELVDVLRNPDKYAILGARAPTGLLLVGPPGTGKTMLARATAATAGVPLLYCSGSDFVEMFVGRGAARVRQLFDRATKLAPCIIFIDELDALGKSRDFGGNAFGSGLMSRSNDEAEQTLNQLLACMDGLDSSRQVCVLAATNRKEVLDPALIRPGRFDRIVKLELPNAYGREQILRVHASKLPGFIEGSGLDVDRPSALGKGRMVDLSAIAAVTDGWSGAELEFLVNEAAIRAVRRVSSALQRGTTPIGDIVPHVEARDFEESLRSFYETRKPKGSGPSAVNDLLKNVWRQ
jgi:ATPase family associated with various cellular activities (AAA)/AAA+ lid domain